MLDEVVSACVIGVGSSEELQRTRQSITSCSMRSVAVTVDDDLVGHEGTLSVNPSSTPAEMLRAGLELVSTRWVLVLIAGETVHVSDQASLLAALHEGRTAFAPSTPLVNNSLVPDPLLIPGARLLETSSAAELLGTTGGAPLWTVTHSLFRPAREAPFRIERRRTPYLFGSSPARWAVACANRRTFERAEKTGTASDLLLDACLLAWAGESEGAIAGAEDLLLHSDRDPVVRAGAARVVIAAALSYGRYQHAADAAEIWATEAPGDPDVAFWQLLVNRLGDKPTDPSTLMGDQGGSEVLQIDPWLVQTVVGESRARWAKLEHEVEACMNILYHWSRSSPPPVEESRALAAELITRWAKLERPAADLIAKWPDELMYNLRDYLLNGEVRDTSAWSSLALAFGEQHSTDSAMLLRAENLIRTLSVSEALSWTIHAKNAGYADWSLLRMRAASDDFPVADRVLSGALALQHAGDTSAEELVRTAAQLCNPSQFAQLLSDLSTVAAGAIPAFIGGASTTEERAQAMLEALSGVGLTPGGEDANRAARRAAQRNK